MVDNVLHAFIVGPNTCHSHAGRAAMSDCVPQTNNAIDCVLVLINQIRFQIEPPIDVEAPEKFDDVLGICGGKSAQSGVHMALDRNVRVLPDVLKSNLDHCLLQETGNEDTKIASKIRQELGLDGRARRA